MQQFRSDVSGRAGRAAPSGVAPQRSVRHNPVEADHGRLKARLRPLRGLKQDRSARVIIAGHGFVQNLRRGHYELAVAEPVNRRGYSTLPGFMTPVGSSARLIARITSVASPSSLTR